jgi:hypothetical protein
MSRLIILLAFSALSLFLSQAAERKSDAPEFLKAKLSQAMGPLPGKEKQPELDVQLIEEIDCGTYVRRYLRYQAEEFGYVPVYLLIPKDALAGKRKAYGILTLHQTHRAGNKVVVGLGNSSNDVYGVELAERGFVCLAPPYPLLADYAPDLKALGYQSGIMKAIWDNKRGMDFLDTLPFVRHGQYAAIGHSLGGHNSLFTAAFDPRIRVVVTSCGFDSFKDYMNGNIKGWTSARYMPKLSEYDSQNPPFDFDDVLKLIAPRPLFINAPIGDSNFKWDSVDRVVASVRPAYAGAGKPNDLHVEHPQCEHSFPKGIREKAYDFIEERLAGKRFRQ